MKYWLDVLYLAELRCRSGFLLQKGLRKNSKMKSKEKTKNKYHNFLKKRYIIFVLVVLIILIFLTVAIYNYSGTEAAAINKAKRISQEYMKKEYGVSLEVEDVRESIFKKVDYHVVYRLSGTSNVYVGVSLEGKKVLYDNYVEACIFDKMNQNYREEAEAIWDHMAEVEIGGNILYPEDKYLSQDKKINYDRAMYGAEFELNIVSRTFNLEQSANALYNTMVYFKHNDIKISKILFFDFSSDEYKNYKTYILEDLEQFEDTDMVLDYLKNYTEE